MLFFTVNYNTTLRTCKMKEVKFLTIKIVLTKNPLRY